MVSTRITGAPAVDGAVTVAAFASFVRSPAMLSAVTPQISHVLQMFFVSKWQEM